MVFINIILILGVLLIYTAIWLSVNLYNLYPMLNYYLRKDRSIASERGYKLPKRLPKISILLPAFHEELVLPYSVKRIFESDYPSRLLEVIVLLEKDDVGTIVVANSLIKKYGIKHLKIEEEDLPRGKPRALNFGLKHITGSIVGVIDAEDIIDKKLLRSLILDVMPCKEFWTWLMTEMVLQTCILEQNIDTGIAYTCLRLHIQTSQSLLEEPQISSKATF